MDRMTSEQIRDLVLDRSGFLGVFPTTTDFLRWYKSRNKTAPIVFPIQPGKPPNVGVFRSGRVVRVNITFPELADVLRGDCYLLIKRATGFIATYVVFPPHR